MSAGTSRVRALIEFAVGEAVIGFAAPALGEALEFEQAVDAGVESAGQAHDEFEEGIVVIADDPAGMGGSNSDRAVALGLASRLRNL